MPADYEKSPFNFKHYHCNSVGVYVDGQSYPAKPLHPDYENDIYVDCYRTITTFRDDINIDIDDYKNGYCLYVLDINPYYTFNTKRKGHCRLEITFAKPLPESVSLLMYGTFPQVLNIDDPRSVFIQ